MRTIANLFLTLLLLASVNCSSAPKATTENVNVAVANTENTRTIAATAVGETAAAQTVPAPDALIKDLYKTHDKDNGAIVQGKNRAILDKYFDKNLADLIWKDMTTNRDEVGVIDFDIFYNAQDADIKNLVVGAAKIDGDKAIVPVTFENFKQKNEITYSLVKEKSVWKISNINYGKGDSLLKYFKDTNESIKTTANEPGEFEGRYQVGETTCTVTPVKMAFEVKWTKGTGTEMFFYDNAEDGKYTFASEPKAGKTNVFSFDDENYTSGTFYRGDGREFPVKRIK